ncbi:hypothetical protein P152DRAFT_463920 [Eremomyces bilateralis CBS 781.70]|uniref:Uncharacterized protein n=1 Tax=Eremomyces bilateralis CBS 781.70 TaxID=1392243 RepID=A0A6G1GEI6_9PEZI|nr:uncharacterized protein P152DRAFT_463920 [Eremomyces bilateralis CBS 781.70]KAF1816311.1 hypothetical protein P152DRAFT_463920 [Eremomyces bilateralis CBS 781.70]
MIFIDLPVDVKTLIVSHIIRPTDLKSLCLTSKQLHAITVRQLYHSVTLDVGGPNDGQLTSLLNVKNIGLPYIRKLDLYLADVPDTCKCNQLQQANVVIRMILEFLPENILEKFSWHPWSPLNADNLLLLYRKQRRMKWMEAIALDRDVLPQLESDPSLKFDELFDNVKKLGLYPDSRDVLNMSHTILRRSKKVEKITLHTTFEDNQDNPIPLRELNDSATAPGLITSTLFRHMMPFESCTPLPLRDLTLQKIGLRYAALTYCKAIDFKNLRALRVYTCSGADTLFAEMSQSSRLPEHLECLEFKHEDNAENDALNAVDGFLCLVSGLKQLTLDICYAKQLPAAAGIARHGKTLKDLNVHASKGDGDEEELVYAVNEFDNICRKATGLQQLSVAAPATSITKIESIEFTSFMNSVSQLHELVTLHITTWPTNNPSAARMPRKIYEHLLQLLAQNIYARCTPSHSSSTTSVPSLPPFINGASTTPTTSNLPPPPPPPSAPSDPPPSTVANDYPYRIRKNHLVLVAFGTSDRVYDREDSTNQVIFLRSQHTDPLGHQSIVATQVGWCLRNYIEPRSDVLDFGLAKSCRPPATEEEGDD